MNLCQLFNCRNPVEARKILCFCPDLDIKDGVDKWGNCKVCDKHVVILHLWKYRPFTHCRCNEKRVNEFWFCENCKGVAHHENGSRPKEVDIVVNRAVYMINKEHRELYGRGFFL
jgi:hypothetical protein